MRICLVLEGSYPYVHGGVSTWMHQYIREMTEHEFIVWTICASQEKKGSYVYDLPANVVEIREIALDEGPSQRRLVQQGLTQQEVVALKELVYCRQPDWELIMTLFQSGQLAPLEFLESELFLEMVQELSLTKYPLVSFADVFHTMRSMMYPILSLLTKEAPQADAYHAISTGYGGLLATMASQLYQKPLILTEHGIYTREREEELIRASWVLPSMKKQWIEFFYLLSDAIYSRADRVTSLFSKARDTQIAIGCQSDKCQIIANGIDFESFAAIPMKEADGWIDIGAIVRLAPIKDIKTLIYAFHEVSALLPQVRLHIMGGIDDPVYAAECYALAKKLQLDRLIFTGRVDIKDYMEGLDFTVLSSLSEGQPLSILESMAAGRPCVTTDVGCCRELLEGQKGEGLGLAGYCVPPTHRKALADAMILMSRESQIREEMGRIAQQRASLYYRYPQMIGKYRQVYKECTS